MDSEALNVRMDWPTVPRPSLCRQQPRLAIHRSNVISILPATVNSIVEAEDTLLPCVSVDATDACADKRSEDHGSTSTRTLIDCTGDAAEDCILHRNSHEVLKLFLEQEVEEFTHCDIHEDGSTYIIAESRRCLADLIHVRVNLQFERSLVAFGQRLRKSNQATQEERGYV